VCIGQCVSAVVVVVMAFIIVNKYMMIIHNVCSLSEGVFVILSSKIIVSGLYIVHKLNAYQGCRASLSLCLKSDRS
jgi:membrane protein YdbS with pleckstrin-like domain